MTNSDALTICRNWLQAKYSHFWERDAPERALLCAAYLCDVVKVRELGGNNEGPWVEAILASTKLGEGYPWCAAFVEFCCDVANYQEGPGDRQAAAVESWFRWARKEGKLTKEPNRGDLCLWRKVTGNHIGFVVDSKGDVIRSIEGNTSEGVSGSQRDGGGVYRRGRNKSTWTHYIRL